MTSLIMIDDNYDDAKRYWKADDVLMTLWPLSLITPPIGPVGNFRTSITLVFLNYVKKGTNIEVKSWNLF